MIDKSLLDILVCPSCKQPVELKDPDPGDDAQARLVCTGCGRRYPVRDDIPIMLIDEAAPPRDAKPSE
ncbi:MAG: Trm112 family protein [Phycisphaerae bacterium]